jgi:hypothetical protein
LHLQLLKQIQLLEQLSRRRYKTRWPWRWPTRLLKETQEWLEVTNHQNQQLQAQLILLAQPGEENKEASRT